ncbi:hypothetical protein PAXRUDRAFT_826185 [Paxillus rubicundulus Ve08.2h10]|uniref:SAP domain-containing protein n=1 Tax=Paxillus rubicundulus Ve08.2h10 TaxID=930991 RepID=A0A0D0E4Q8_9AGAM|nr:hypothetical protein PAXRUDRAFT_826185 [Paxillus rubicundulus Ve08.2h10]
MRLSETFARRQRPAVCLRSKGNKSTLIARIQEYEESRAVTTSVHGTPAVSRSTSTKAAPGTTPTSFPAAPQSASPGIPPAAQFPTTSRTPIPLAIKIPDLSRPVPEAPNQVPYVPDFWDSARPREDIPCKPELPKLHVVSGSATHHGGGPTHNLEEHQEGHTLPPTTINADEPPSSKVGVWADVLDDIGLPRSFSVRHALREAGASVVEAVKDRGNAYRTSSRPLDNDERMGLYVLLGLVVGSWIVGGVVNRAAPAVKEENSTRVEH